MVGKGKQRPKGFSLIQDSRHYPVGLLFDLHATDLSKTWNLTLHFKDLPSDLILLKPTAETVQDMFMSMIKEVTKLIHRCPAILLRHWIAGRLSS